MAVVQELPRDRERAVSMLFAVHHKRLVGLARVLVDDLPTAEDVVQDAFLSLYRRWPWMRDRNASLPYLQTAVLNKSRSHLRHRRTVRALIPRQRPEEVSSAETFTVEREQRDELITRIGQLPARQRQVLVLRYYYDLSEAEIATTLSISRGSVKQHATRALSSLHTALEPVR